MNKRERILVVAMSVALVAGGLSVVSDLSKRKSGKTGKAGSRTLDLGVQAFADTQRAALSAVRLTPGEKSALDRAAGPWAESPFIDRVGGIRAGAGAVSEFRYTGFMQFGESRLAIVNGREYRTGETITATDFIVETIEPSQVILVAGKGRRVTVPLQTANARRNIP
ncbi:MAG TPA: hypothetical protein PKC67_05255 [Kiritimatiellia bacterium]|nr:hypothetical protein [Kiritimatiellia bacterium]HMP33740.1 hypothetical protein [Kiritimatiellia bacterium]